MSAADWSLPTVGSNYTDVLGILKGRDEDAANMFHDAATNVPTNAVKYNRASDKFQYWTGSVWTDLVLSIAGGGTGANTASAARTALGLGSIATQDGNAVSITGGTISGVTMSASVITSGILPLNRGGSGASLALGSAGQVMRVNDAASAVEFNNVPWANVTKTGSSIADLVTRSAGDLSSGILPLARLSALTTTQFASAAISQWTNDSAYVTASIINSLNASNLSSGTVPLARLSGITTTQLSTPNISQFTNNNGYIDGSSLNASNLSSGIVPLARLSGITNTEISASAGIAYSKLSLGGSIVSGDIISLVGSKVSGNISGNAANITAYSINQNLTTTSNVNFNAVFAGAVTGAAYRATAVTQSIINLYGGIASIQGQGGTESGLYYYLYWTGTGALELWIGSTKIGNISYT